MAIYKRGGVYWYEFVFNGERVRESTNTGNQNAARQIEAARRLALAKGEAGIQDREPCPTLEAFAERFEAEIETACADKPATVSFYKERMRRILADPILPKLSLDAISKSEIDDYRQRRSRQVSRLKRPNSPASVNRELATLRRLLRLAQQWDVIARVPPIRMLRGEHNREFVLSHKLEPVYLDACPQPLRDVAILILETGIRPGEAVSLNWANVHLQPAIHARLGFISIRSGKSKNARRNLSLTQRACELLRGRKALAVSEWVFPGEGEGDGPFLVSSLDHQHEIVRDALKLQKDFVIHSCRHSMLTRLGEAGADAFTIMRIAGHSSVTVSQRYVHPTPESLEKAFDRLEALNAAKAESTDVKPLAVGAVPTKVPTVKKGNRVKRSQVVDFNRAGA
jgi:integrase